MKKEDILLTLVGIVAFAVLMILVPITILIWKSVLS